MFRIQTLDNIASAGLDRLPKDRYEVRSDIGEPDAILVRSQNMHEMALGPNLLTIGRAGAGVNNIPVEEMTERGIPIFNAPGANANAVKELVLGGLFMGLFPAITTFVALAIGLGLGVFLRRSG